MSIEEMELAWEEIYRLAETMDSRQAIMALANPQMIQEVLKNPTDPPGAYVGAVFALVRAIKDLQAEVAILRRHAGSRAKAELEAYDRT